MFTPETTLKEPHLHPRPAGRRSCAGIKHRHSPPNTPIYLFVIRLYSIQSRAETISYQSRVAVPRAGSMFHNKLCETESYIQF